MEISIRHCVISIDSDEFPLLFGKVASFDMDKDNAVFIVFRITKNGKVWLGLWKNSLGDCHVRDFDDSPYKTIAYRAAEIRVEHEGSFVIRLGLHEFEDAKRFIAEITSKEILEQLKKENFFNILK